MAVHVYGLMYAIGVFAAVMLTARLWERRGGRRELVHDVALWAFPAGLIGGRLYFLATSWSEVPEHWWGPLAIWKGGLSIWGGIALGTVVGIWRLRRAGADAAAFMDVAAPGLLIAQAIGRIGNYFNQELFGRPTDLPWALEIDAAHRPQGYAGSTGFHPTFLYELTFDLALAAVLLVLLRRGRIRPPGVFALYVAGYSGFRILEELLRIDPSHHILGLRLNFFVAVALCLAGIAWFARTQHGRQALGRGAHAGRDRRDRRDARRVRPRAGAPRPDSGSRECSCHDAVTLSCGVPGVVPTARRSMSSWFGAFRQAPKPQASCAKASAVTRMGAV